MYEKKGNLTEANVNIEKSFKLNRGSSSFAPYNVRGRIRLKAGDYEGAVADFTVSIRFIPFDTSNYLNRGLAFFLMGKSVEAQKDFDIYLEKFPKGKEELDKRLEEAKQRKANEK
jgi:tetratricopeptide (TPR) repeat protein